MVCYCCVPIIIDMFSSVILPSLYQYEAAFQLKVDHPRTHVFS